MLSDDFIAFLDASDTDKQRRMLRLAQLDKFALASETARAIAHEINQPLCALAAYAQAIRRLSERGAIDVDSLGRLCAKLDEQARRAGEVVQSFRDRIRDPYLVSLELDVNALVRGIEDLIQAAARAENIPFEIEYGQNVPRVRGDPVELQYAVLSLVRNSIEAMRDEVHDALGIRIRTAGDERRALISVTDYGSGVASGVGENIFNAFVTTKAAALGVGLSISSRIVQTIGGTLTYLTDTVGTTFTISLPAIQAES
jgi:two-component system sensor kinase FixL